MEDNYEEILEALLKDADYYIDVFKKDLEKSSLSEKTKKNHILNIVFFLKDYLAYRELATMEEGCWKVDDFLGYFFIRKCMWSTPDTVRSNAASLKKFYKCMSEHGLLADEDYEEFKNTVKMDLHDWMDECAEFNNPSGAYW